MQLWVCELLLAQLRAVCHGIQNEANDSLGDDPICYLSDLFVSHVANVTFPKVMGRFEPGVGSQLVFSACTSG